MDNNQYSFTNYFTFKKNPYTIDIPKSDKYKSYLTYNRYDISNNLLNSVDFYTHKDFHSPKRVRRINSTYGTDFLKNRKYCSKITNNTKEVDDEEIKCIIESIESIKENQKEILSIIKELKSNKNMDAKSNNKNNINQENKEQAKDNEINELKNSINKINNFENELKQMNDKIKNIISKTTKIEEILNNSTINVFRENNQIDNNQNPIQSNLQQSTSIVNQSNGRFIEMNNQVTIQEENNE